jgi:hypothetical protein
MKRFILATAAALALAACSDTNPAIDTRAPAKGPNHVIDYSQSYTIFTDQTPARTSIDTEGGREVGTQFTIWRGGGIITHFRFWKAVGETGTHTAKLWTTSGTLLASATFSGETSSGWQSVSASNTAIEGGTYVVSVKTAMYFDTYGAISNNYMYADLSYHGQPAGSFPTTAASGIYFVDVNFNPFICCE